MIKETYALTAPKSVDPAGFLREQLASASPDLLREMVKTFADALMSAEADAACGAGSPAARSARIASPAPADGYS
jgi:putative transposase